MPRLGFTAVLRGTVESLDAQEQEDGAKENQAIEIEKTHRDPLLSFNQAVTVDCSDFLGTALSFQLTSLGISIDSRPLAARAKSTFHVEHSEPASRRQNASHGRVLRVWG